MRVVHGDCIEVMKTMSDNSVDSIVTDPPYGLGFMGKEWDALPPGEDWARECLRVLKPGGHLIAFGGTRTWHRLAVAVEDAGFEIRDSIAWMYSSGMPKSLDVSKAIDKRRDDRADILRVTTFLADHAASQGVSRKDVNEHMGTSDMAAWWLSRLPHRSQCPSLEQWELLKAFLRLPNDMDAEVWRLNERKGTLGEAWGAREVVGERRQRGTQNQTAAAFNNCNSATEVLTVASTLEARQWEGWGTALKPSFEPVVLARKPLVGTVAANVVEFGTGAVNISGTRNGDRWPANVILDESQAESLAQSKYFYTPKASKAERQSVSGTTHPTVKPIALMRWLVRLVTPPGGTVLEPFAGSGATIEACILEGFDYIAIEREAEYIPLIQARIDRQEAA